MGVCGMNESEMGKVTEVGRGAEAGEAGAKAQANVDPLLHRCGARPRQRGSNSTPNHDSTTRRDTHTRPPQVAQPHHHTPCPFAHPAPPRLPPPGHDLTPRRPSPHRPTPTQRAFEPTHMMTDFSPAASNYFICTQSRPTPPPTPRASIQSPPTLFRPYLYSEKSGLPQPPLQARTSPPRSSPRALESGEVKFSLPSASHQVGLPSSSASYPICGDGAAGRIGCLSDSLTAWSWTGMTRSWTACCPPCPPAAACGA